MKKEWKKEIARDVLALGSWVFFVLVIGRALIKPYRPFVDQIVIAGIILLVIGFIVKDMDGYVARGLVLIVFTILFYEDNVYTGFVTVAGILMLLSSKYVGNSWKKIIIGLIVGLIGIGAGYFVTGMYV